MGMMAAPLVEMDGGGQGMPWALWYEVILYEEIGPELWYVLEFAV